MKRVFLFRLALLNTFKRKLRAILAIGGIALSSGVMVFLFGVGDGLKSLVTNEIIGSNVRDVVTVNQRNADQIKLNQERISAIKSTSGVGDVQQVVGTVSEVSYHGMNISMPVYGVTQGYFALAPSEKLAGALDNQPHTDSDSVIISNKVLDAFNLGLGDAVGKKITVNITIQSAYASGQTEPTKVLAKKEYTIVGVANRGSLPVAYVSLEGLMKNGVDSVSQLKIRLTNPDKMPAVREVVEQMGFQTSSVQDAINQVNRIFSVIQHILLLFGFITLVIAVFSTFNIITLTLIEETKQIGFLRIMGMQKRDVGFLFIAQAMMLTTVGAVAGVICGNMIGFITNGIAQAMVGRTVFSGEIYIFVIPFGPSLIMLMFSIVLGWLIGKLPAKRAVLIAPLEELKA